MIARLTGILDEIRPSECILDVGGVGYRVHIPLSTYEKIQGGGKTSLHIHTLHREDMFRLYGFYTVQERELFALLLDISGIGPSMALSILSWITVDRFIQAVAGEDTSSLTSIPGIGKAKAEKLVFEMKRKTKRLEELSSGVSTRSGGRRDAVEALMALGFDEKKASSTVDAIVKNNPDLSLEKIIKDALKNLT